VGIPAFYDPILKQREESPRLAPKKPGREPGAPGTPMIQVDAGRLNEQAKKARSEQRTLSWSRTSRSVQGSDGGVLKPPEKEPKRKA